MLHCEFFAKEYILVAIPGKVLIKRMTCHDVLVHQEVCRTEVFRGILLPVLHRILLLIRLLITVSEVASPYIRIAANPYSAYNNIIVSCL